MATQRATTLGPTGYIQRWWRRLPGSRARRLGPYALLERLGAGAMGEVYRARHVTTGELRAVKLLGSKGRKRRECRFEQEARFGERLWHPNKVCVYEHGVTSDGTRYLVMELVDGVTLQALVEREGALSPLAVIDILLQLAAVLAEMHDHGFVHRDITPSNAVVRCDADCELVVKLLDFGLVKHLAEPTSRAAQEEVVGTPLYISPEALTTPESVDGRTDIYGLGAVAYHLLSGAPVFAGPNLIAVCAQHLHAAPQPLPGVRLGTLSRELGDLVLECLEKAPAARPRSARELSQRLVECRAVEAKVAARSPVPAQRSTRHWLPRPCFAAWAGEVAAAG
jgi:serine/threonine-protein kinase